MYKKRRVKVPVFNGLTKQWIGSVNYNRTEGFREFLDDVCEYQEELGAIEMSVLSQAVGRSIQDGWYSNIGGNRICVVFKD